MSKELLESQYDVIKQLIAYTAYRYGLSASDAEEFQSLVFLKLIENDYEALREYQGRNGASLATYLTVVITRFCLDYRVAQWGKWRPSAAATRQGDLAMLLERLIYRNGFSFGEACQLLRTNYGFDLSDDELERLRALLPPRTPRRLVDDSALVDVPADDVDAESAAMYAEGQEQGSRMWQVLTQAIRDLDPQDQLILKLRFSHGLTVAQISRTLGLPQPTLYPRLHRILAMLRRRLEDEGFGPAAIDGFFPPDQGGPRAGAIGKGLN